jgi:phosphoribosylformimino-5-aminoimidazole carboxamide ribotide isomerase
MSLNQEGIKVIPAIDIQDGKCVRLTQGEFDSTKVYFEDPLTAAKKFADAGYSRLHLVDLDAAQGEGSRNTDIISRIASKTNMKLQVGGGIRSAKRAEEVLDLGVNQIVIGTLAVKNPDLLEEIGHNHGKNKIIISLDVKAEEVLVSGWQSGSGKNIFTLLKDYLASGFQYFLVTDIAKDGMLAGPNLNLYQDLVKRFPNAKIIASGGVRNENDIESLSEEGLFAAVVGKAFYEGRITL